MSFLDDLLNEKTANKWVAQNSPEWNRVRLGRFTSSEMYRLMDPSKREMTKAELKERPKKGPGSSAKLTYDYSKLSDEGMNYVNEKVAEVLTGQCKSQGYAFPIVWGTENEDEAVKAFEWKTGLETEKVGFFTYSDHAGGSPDRLVGDNAILEVKCPYDSVNQIKYLILTDEYDVRNNYFGYWCQCQANMLFTDTDLCHFCTFDPRMINDKHKLTHIEIHSDEKFRQLLIHQIGLAVKEKLSLIQTLSK